MKLNNDQKNNIKIATRNYIDNMRKSVLMKFMKIYEVIQSSKYINDLLESESSFSEQYRRLEQEIGDVILDEWERYE